MATCTVISVGFLCYGRQIPEIPQEPRDNGECRITVIVCSIHPSIHSQPLGNPVHTQHILVYPPTKMKLLYIMPTIILYILRTIEHPAHPCIYTYIQYILLYAEILILLTKIHIHTCISKTYLKPWHSFHDIFFIKPRWQTTRKKYQRSHPIILSRFLIYICNLVKRIRI